MIKKSRFRTALPQVIAGVSAFFLLFDIGISTSYPTVLISALTGLNDENNPNESLEITAAQVSWLAGINYIGKLFGSLSSGFVSETLGRRTAMLLINIPHLLAFLLFYFSTSTWNVFVAIILLGFGSGFLKAPSSCFVAEISEVSIRGILISMSTIALTVGPLIIFSLGALTAWRNIALYCGVIQILTTILLCFIPESPMWLLSKERDEKSMKSLRWYRGWVPQEVVQQEFDSMTRHRESTNSCEDCKIAMTKCTHRSKSVNISQNVKELIQRRTLKPFTILMAIAVASFYSGSHHLSAYMVQILNTYHSPISPNVGTIIVSVTGLLGTFAGIIGIKMLGKRKSYLIALVGVVVSSFTLTVYGYLYLPKNVKSYEQELNTDDSDDSVVPLIFFCSMRLFTTVTMLIPLAMLSELYSQRARSMATAVTTALNNLLTFTAIKSFYNLEHFFDLPTALGVYCAIGIIGFVVLYNILPETEGRTLEDIEIHFSDPKRKLTDRFIVKNSLNEK